MSDIIFLRKFKEKLEDKFKSNPEALKVISNTYTEVLDLQLAVLNMGVNHEADGK